MSIINDISDALQRGKKKEVTKLVQQAIDEGIDATTILKDHFFPEMPQNRLEKLVSEL